MYIENTRLKRLCVSGLYNVMTYGDMYKFRIIVNTQFAQDIGPMCMNGFRAEEHLFSDLRYRLPLSQTGKDLKFTFGEFAEW